MPTRNEDMRLAEIHFWTRKIRNAFHVRGSHQNIIKREKCTPKEKQFIVAVQISGSNKPDTNLLNFSMMEKVCRPICNSGAMWGEEFNSGNANIPPIQWPMSLSLFCNQCKKQANGFCWKSRPINLRLKDRRETKHRHTKFFCPLPSHKSVDLVAQQFVYWITQIYFDSLGEMYKELIICYRWIST